MAKKQITKKELLTLEGIRVLSNKYNNYLEDLVTATANITGEKLDDNYGLAADFIYCSDETVAQHLKKLDIKIKK